MTEEKPSFEKDLERLEAIVNALEEGGLSLDASLTRFEEGIKLAQRCEKALTAAEKKIEILVKNAENELEAQPFDEESAEAADTPSAKPKKPKRAAKTPEQDSEKAPPQEDMLFGEEEGGDLPF